MARKSKPKELDRIIQASLCEFATWIDSHAWFGREKEAVSLYVLGFLQNQCRPLSILSDPTQIAIDVAVPQLPAATGKSKQHVNKDLVIWDKPGKTCWNRTPAVGEKLAPAHWPLCIMEWKRAKSHRESKRDCQWLEAFSRRAPASFCGFTVVFGACRGEPRLRCARVSRNGVQEDWFACD